MWVINRYLGKISNKKDKYAIILLLFIVILKTNAFNYVNWNSTYGGWINNLLTLGLIFYWIFLIKSSRQMNFRKEVYLMMFLPFLSIFNSWSLYGQSPASGAWALMSHFTWIIYFALHKYRISESALLKLFFLVAFIIAFIQIIQQFTYPNAMFGVVSSDVVIEKGLTEIAESRNGLWRFRMHRNAYFTTPILFISLIWLQRKYNLKILIIVLLLIISVYLTLTRQVIAASIITIIYSVFIKKKINSHSILLGLIFIACLYSFYDVLFSSLAKQTTEESNEDNIRLLSAAYFWKESLKTPFTFLFGIGKGAGNSLLALTQEKMSSDFGFYTTDVGFIGAIYENGVLFVLSSYYILYRLFINLKNTLPIYIRLFTLFTGIMSPMIFPFAGVYQIVIWTIILYISDLYINSKKTINNDK